VGKLISVRGIMLLNDVQSEPIIVAVVDGATVGN